MNLKDECPHRPAHELEALKLEKAERKQKSDQYKTSLKRQRPVAVAALRSMGKPVLKVKDKVEDGHMKCMVCLCSIPKDLLPKSKYWHYVWNKQWLYCPLGDLEVNKYDILEKFGNYKACAGYREKGNAWSLKRLPLLNLPPKKTPLLKDVTGQQKQSTPTATVLGALEERETSSNDGKTASNFNHEPAAAALAWMDKDTADLDVVNAKKIDNTV